jgi:hypothetical protein
MKRLLLVILAMAVGLGVAAPTPLSAQITRTLVVYLGAWSGSISYNVNDMVTYGGLTYISKVANNSGHTPASLSSYWDALSSNAPVATNSTLGLMKPDGTSCTVSAGVLSCSGSGGSGSVVGQTPNYVGLATNANTIGGPSHINESTAGITQVTQTLGTSTQNLTAPNASFFTQPGAIYGGLSAFEENYTLQPPLTNGTSGHTFNMTSYGPYSLSNGLLAAEGTSATTVQIYDNMSAASTKQALTIWHFAPSVGDTGGIYLYNASQAGRAYSSDEGNVAFHELGGEAVPDSPTVGTYSAPNITFSAHNCGGPGIPQQCWPSAGSQLVETTAPIVTTQLRGYSTGFTAWSAPCNTAALYWMYQMATSGGLPTTSVGGCAINVNLEPNTTPDAPVSTSIAMQGGSGTFSIGDSVAVIGNQFLEESKITGVSGSAPTQTITLPITRPNVSVVVLKSHLHNLTSAADLASPYNLRTGYWATDSLDGTNLIYMTEGTSSVNPFQLPQQYSEQMQVSLPATTSFVYNYTNTYVFDGVNDQQNITTSSCTSGSTFPAWNSSLNGHTTWGTCTFANRGTTPSNVTLYPAARIVKSGSGTPPSTFQLGPNGGTWSAEVVSDTNFDEQGTAFIQGTNRCLTAGEAGCQGFFFQESGLGATASNGGAIDIENANDESFYLNADGSLKGAAPPTFMSAGTEGFGGSTSGLFGSDFISNLSPYGIAFQWNNWATGQTSMTEFKDPAGNTISSNTSGQWLFNGNSACFSGGTFCNSSYLDYGVTQGGVISANAPFAPLDGVFGNSSTAGHLLMSGESFASIGSTSDRIDLYASGFGYPSVNSFAGGVALRGENGPNTGMVWIDSYNPYSLWPAHVGNVGLNWTAGNAVPYPLSVHGIAGFGCSGSSTTVVGTCPAQIDASGDATFVALTATGSLSSGVSPPTGCSTITGGCLGLNEATGSGTPTVGQFYMYVPISTGKVTWDVGAAGETSIWSPAQGGSGVANTATLTLGTSNQNWATLATGIVKNTTTTGAISDAVAADVYGLWSGSCSSSTFLRGDGACAAAGGSVSNLYTNAGSLGIGPTTFVPTDTLDIQDTTSGTGNTAVRILSGPGQLGDPLDIKLPNGYSFHFDLYGHLGIPGAINNLEGFPTVGVGTSADRADTGQIAATGPIGTTTLFNDSQNQSGPWYYGCSLWVTTAWAGTATVTLGYTDPAGNAQSYSYPALNTTTGHPNLNGSPIQVSTVATFATNNFTYAVSTSGTVGGYTVDCTLTQAN